MTVLDRLLNSLNTDAPVRAILVGAHWTVVCSAHCGMAATFCGEHPYGHFQVKDAGQLHTKTARELAEYARSDYLLEASIGIAAINSLLPLDESWTVERNAVEVISEHGKGKNVALIGHFPFIPRLRETVGALWVIEQQPTVDEYPAECAADFLPRADVIAITSSTLINHTLDDLLALCRPGAIVMMLGPSTPLSPLLFEQGVSILSGSKVVDEQAVLRTAGQGASFQQVEGVRRITIRREPWNLS